MTQKTYITKSPTGTIKLGKKIAKTTLPGRPLALIGELGSGKTTFTQGFGQYFGINRMTSPTYTYIKEYTVSSDLNENTKYRLNHIDLYRAPSIAEIFSLGIDELLRDNLSWTIIEWPEKIMDLLPDNAVIIEFAVTKNNQRRITITQ